MTSGNQDRKIVRQTQFAPDMPANVTSLSITLTPHVVDELQAEVGRFQKAVELEDTWSARNWGVPSPIVRVDCLADDHRIFVVCEVDERPMGVWFASQMNEQFSELVGKFQQEHWPRFIGLTSPDRPGDLNQWIESICVTQSCRLTEGTLVWPAGRPEDKAFHDLIAQSVAPVRLEGDKRYLERLLLNGGAREITSEGFLNLDLREQWLLKPIQGTRCRDVFVWWGDGPFKPRKDVETSLSRAQRRLREGKWLVQRYYMPPLLPDEIRGALIKENERYGKYAYLCRAYFAFCPEGRRGRPRGYHPVGGFWVARSVRGKGSSAVIHGTPDAVAGPLLLPKQSIPSI